MDLELLRTFLEVHRVRHFGRSGEALGLTQAAISQRIRTLEELLGVRLFDRTTREIRITPEGNRLIAHAERLMAGWRTARQDVAPARTGEQLTLGGSLRLWNALLQPWLDTLRRSFPSLAIVAESNTPELLMRGLIDGALDVAVMLEPAQLDIVQIKEVAALSLVLVSTKPGVTANDALGHGYVYVDWGLAHGLEHRRRFPDALEAMTRVSQARMASEHIRAVGGSAYLPVNMVAQELREKSLFEVLDAPVLRRKVYGVYLVRSARHEFIETCLNLIPDPNT